MQMYKCTWIKLNSSQTVLVHREYTLSVTACLNMDNKAYGIAVIFSVS